MWLDQRNQKKNFPFYFLLLIKDDLIWFLCFPPFGIGRRKDKEPPRSVIFRSVKGVI